MQVFAAGQLTRVLTIALSLAVMITCASPTSPTSKLVTGEQFGTASWTTTPSNAVASVTVSLLYPKIAIGAPDFASARVHNAAGFQLNGRHVVWHSDNVAVATVVPSTGFIRGVGNGTATIIATVNGVVGQATLAVGTATPLPLPLPPPTQVATHVAITSQPSAGVTGVAFVSQPVVQIRDASNAAVTTSNAPVTAVISSGVGTLGGTTTVNAVNGVATFTNLTVTGTGVFTLTFTSIGLTQATSRGITISEPPPAPATQLAIATQPSGAVSGALLGTQPVIQIHHANNMVVATSNAAVTAAITSGTGVLAGTTTVSAVNGAAAFTNLRVTGAGFVMLTFTSNGMTQATSHSISITAVPASQLAIVAQPSGTAASAAAFAVQPAVALRDASNNPMLQAGVNVTAAIASGGGTLGGTLTATTNASGVASFANLSITGTAGDRTLSFSAASLSGVTSNSITITVTAPPPPPPPAPGGMLFAADWSAGDPQDGGRFDFIGTSGPSPRCGVVTAASTGLPFPPANVLEVPAGSDRGWCFPRKTGLPLVPVGGSRYYRVYLSIHLGASSDNQTHPIQDANAGSGINWEIAIRHDATDTPDYQFQFQFHTTNGWPWQHINLRERLRKATVYRVEWALHRVSETQFTFDVRIHDAAGNLLYSAADFRADDGNGIHSATRPVNFNNPANLTGLNTGLNQSGWMPAGSLYGYEAGMCVRSDTWCGPYVPGERP